MGEKEVGKAGGGGAILRFALVLGEEGGVLNDFEREANFGPFLIVPGSGQAKLQPILREDAARCVVDSIGRPDLLGKIIELGGPEVVTFETILDWFIQARGVKKRKLKLPVPLLVPGAMAMEPLFTNPTVTPAESNPTHLHNIPNTPTPVAT